MVVGILTTASEMERFEDVFQDLKRIAGTPVGRYASGEVRLPQVHALNCLKDVFTDTRLASVSEAHAADCLSIAANCLDSELSVPSQKRFMMLCANANEDGQFETRA